MKLIKLVGDEVKPVYADPYTNPKTGTKHFNIIIGSNKDIAHRRHIKLDSNIFGNPILDKSFELIDNDYIIKPIYNKSNNSTFNYVLSKDNSEVHKNDVLLIWELPNVNQENTETEIKGVYDKLLETTYVKRRQDKRFESPILVLELMSDCTLSMTINGVKKTLYFNYKTSEFKKV